MSTQYYARQAPKFYKQALFTESSVQLAPLGAKWPLADGREFIYCKDGGSGQATGTLLQTAAPEANHLNKTVAVAAAIGDTTVTVNIVATAVTANQYAEGWLHINDATGEGYAYKIRSHPAASASATCVFTLYDAIRVALVADTSEYTLTKHRCADVIVFPTTQTGAPVGFTTHVVTASYYFWAQRKGELAVLTNGAVVVGNDVIPSTGVAGAVMAGGTNDIVGAVGRVMQVNADTEYSLIIAAIPG